MSKLFTKKRRVGAKEDFQMRVEMTLQKQKLKKKELIKKYYNYDFKPQINKKRININPKNLHKNVFKRDKANKAKQNEFNIKLHKDSFRAISDNNSSQNQPSGREFQSFTGNKVVVASNKDVVVDYQIKENSNTHVETVTETIEEKDQSTKKHSLPIESDKNCEGVKSPNFPDF